MSTLEDLDDMEHEEKKEEKKDEGDKDGKKPNQDGDAEMKDADGEKDEEKDEDLIDSEVLHSSTRDITMRRRLLDNDMRIMKSEFQRLTHEQAAMKEKIKENLDKIENNRCVISAVSKAAMPQLLRCTDIYFLDRQLPYLVGNVVELLDLDVEKEAAEEGANIDLDATRVGKSAVIKTSTRQTIFLPLIGLVDHASLKPGDLIGVNKDSYLVLDTLPAEYDSRVKAMEVDEKPTEKYTDVGGLDKQIEELVEAVVWPMKEAERFKKIGIKAPKGKQHLLPSAFRLPPDSCTRTTILMLRLRHRSAHVRPPWNRQNPPGSCLCRPDRRYLPQARRPSARANVHR